MNRFYLLLIAIATLFLASCEQEEFQGKDLQYLKFSPTITTTGLTDSTTLFSNDTLIIQVQLNNKIFEKGINYDLNYIPKNGGGAVLFLEEQMIAKKDVEYLSEMNDDVIFFKYVPSENSKTSFKINLTAEGKYTKELSFDFNVIDPNFKITIQNLPEHNTIDIHRIYEIDVLIENFDKDTESKDVLLSASFIKNEGLASISQNNKSTDLLSSNASVKTGTTIPIKITGEQLGEIDIAFTIVDKTFTQDFNINVVGISPEFTVAAYRISEDEIHQSGDFQAQVTINPYAHPKNKVFDIYSEIYRAGTGELTKSGENENELVSRTLLAKGVSAKTGGAKRTSTNNDIISETVTVPVLEEGNLTYKVIAISEVYGNDKDDEIDLFSKSAEFALITNPSYERPIATNLSTPIEIQFMSFGLGAAHSYTISYSLVGEGSLKDDKGFVLEPNNAYAFNASTLTFTPSLLGENKLSFTTIAYSEGKVLERKDFSFIFNVSVNPLVINVRNENENMSDGVPIKFFLTAQKENWEQDNFNVIYTIAKGTGELKQGAKSINPNANFTVTNNIEQTFTFTADAVGEHELYFNFEVDGDELVKHNIMLDVKANIKTSVTPSGAAGSVTGAGYYSKGSFFTLESSSNDGFLFQHIKQGGEIISSERTITAAATKSEEFVFVYVPLATINFSATTGGDVSELGGLRYAEGSSISSTASANAGYSFAGWYIQDTESLAWEGATINITVTKESASYEARFTPNYYNVTFSSATGGEVGSVGGSYVFGSSANSTATTLNGYSFKGWYSGETVEGSNAVINVTVGAEDAAYQARFTPKQFSVTFSSGGGGTITKSGGIADFASSLSSTAIANNGFRHIGWFKDNSLTHEAAKLDVVVSEAANYEARFVKNTVVVTVTSDRNQGSVAGGGTITIGNSVTVTASPVASHNFSGWFNESGTKVSSSLRYTLTASVNITLTAQFLIKTYVVSATKNLCIYTQRAIFNISGLGEYNHGTNASGSVTPGRGVTIHSVSANGITLSNSYGISPITSNTQVKVDYTDLNHLVISDGRRVYLSGVTLDFSYFATIELTDGGGTPSTKSVDIKNGYTASNGLKITKILSFKNHQNNHWFDFYDAYDIFD